MNFVAFCLGMFIGFALTVLAFRLIYPPEDSLRDEKRMASKATPQIAAPRPVVYGPMLLQARKRKTLSILR